MDHTTRAWLAGALLLAVTALMPAQEGRGGGRLTGTVVDEQGNALENVTITLKYMEFTNVMKTVTNKKGQWGFLGIGKGSVQVIAEAEGFPSATTQLLVSGVAPNPEVRIVMKKDPAAGVQESRDAIVRANSLFDNRQYEEALALYQEFAAKNPEMFKIGIYIGNCKAELRDYEGALAEYQKVLDTVSRDTPDLKGNVTAAQAYAGIGDVFLRQQKFKEAEQNFRRSIDIQPGDPALPYNVAEIMFAQNKVDEAEAYYRMAVQAKPEWPKPYLKLAYVALNKGLMDKAVEHLKKFCEVGKDDPKLAEAQALLDSLQKK